MTASIENLIRSGAAAAAASLIAVVLAACGLQSIEHVVLGQDQCRGPVAYVAVDTSGSTLWARHPGGWYERDLRGAITQLARRCAKVFVTTADGNAVADAVWWINGAEFSQMVNGNGRLGAADRVRDARKLWPELRRILTTTHVADSDLLGVLQRIALAAQDVPKGTRKIIIMESDMVANVPAKLINLYTHPPVTNAERRALIARLRAAGQLADLHGFQVYIGGIALNAPRPVAQATIAFWRQLIPAMGGKLVSADSTVRFS